MSVDWRKLFPDDPFRLRMGLTRGSAAGFFRPGPGSDGQCRLRTALVRNSPEYCVLLPDEAREATAEAVARLENWTGLTFPDALATAGGCAADWVVLTPASDGLFRVAAGIVCFPSSWSLPEKAGMTLAEVHGPVPELNDALGRSIDTFLLRMEPGEAWLRSNWGMTSSPQLDHHPRHRIPALPAGAALGSTWLRLEEQVLTLLPHSHSVLFGIRVSVHRLDQLLSSVPGLAGGVAVALESMFSAMADYKGLIAARDSLASHCRAWSGDAPEPGPEDAADRRE